MKQLTVIVFSIILFVLSFLFFLRPIDLTTADLGRHIANGREIVESGNLLNWRAGIYHINYYSQTMSSALFVNHHWGSGVIFYLFNKLFGFDGLSIFSAFINALTIVIIFFLASEIAGTGVALGLSLVVLPLFLTRIEVRPESFSYLFISLSLLIWWRYLHNRLSKKMLWILPIIMLFWVNLHIGFILGVFISTVFVIAIPIRSEGRSIKIASPYEWTRNDTIIQSFGILCFQIIATLINPNFIRGVVAPLTLFSNYGYRLYENQSVLFLEKLGFAALNQFLLLKILLFATLIGSIIFIFLQGATLPGRQGCTLQKGWLALTIITLVFGIMAFFSIRYIPLFGLAAIPFFALVFSVIRSKFSLQWREAIQWFTIIVLFIVGIIQTMNVWQGTIARRGMGLINGVNVSAEFFRKNNLHGPIFNNYDIGSYLIYHLYPKERVFVDNRPEAYSVPFFQTYIKAQEDENAWKALDSQYNFNVIFFSHRDMTPWGQAFLVAKIADPAWAPVFADQYAIIFLKRNQKNAALIRQFELPQSAFSVRQP